MKLKIYLPLALLIALPSIANAEIHGDFTLGLRTTHFSSGDKSAKFGEYRDMSNGPFGDINALFDNETYYLGLSLENPGLDDQSYELSGGLFGLGKGRLYFDELTHQISLNALTPLVGIGSNILTLPGGVVPPTTAWTPFDYDIQKKTYGAELTIDPQHIPFYFKTSIEQQRSEGTIPWGALNGFTGFEVPMPVDYTTNNFMVESGYRNEKTSIVINGGISVFENKNDLFVLDDGTGPDETSTAADNYSYNFGGRLVQRLPMDSILALKASYTRSISEADWSGYTTIALPSADGDYDGDVEYLRANAALSTRWSNMLDTRLFYSYIDRNNDSEAITSLSDFGILTTNELYEYDKHEAGVDANYRLNKTNKLSSGYTFTHTNQTREDADSTTDNLFFAQLKNTSLDWMITKLRLEYLNRSSDTAYDAAYLAADHQNQYFTPFDYASKDQYKAKLAFDFTPVSEIGIGLSYALVYADYDASQLGMQDEQKHQIYLDIHAQLPAKIRLNSYAGYERTKSNFTSRNYTGTATEDPTVADTLTDYNWDQETTYDFFVIGGSLSIPLIQRLELIFTADHQLVDGNIDFARSTAAGGALASVTEADDYYKTQLGAKGIYQVTDAWSVTLGYLFEKSNLDEWKYNNYSLSAGLFNLSGAGLDSDYEAHQVYMTTTFHF